MGLGVLDRLLAPLVLIFMIVGTAVGATTGDAVPRAFDQVQLKGVSFRMSFPSRKLIKPATNPQPPDANAAIVIGLLVMMWPVLTKVQYERLPEIAREKKLWYQIGISLVLNWIIGQRYSCSSHTVRLLSAATGPFIMLAIAWATLPASRCDGHDNVRN